MKKILLIIFMAAALTLNICQKGFAENEKNNPNIIPVALYQHNDLSVAETLSTSGEFKCFSTLLQCSGLAKALKGRGPYTIFAPTDAAFAKLPPGTVQRLMCPQYKCELNRLMRYHIVAEPLSCQQIAEAFCIKTSDGRCITIKKGCRTLCLDKSQVIQTNVCAKNGLIHVIDKILVPGIA